MSNFTPFTAESRQSILQECFELICWVDDFADGYNLHSIKGTPAFIEALRHGDTQKDKLRNLIQKYRDRLPIVGLSRCPYCQAVNYLTFDAYDLDGLWWHCEKVIRARERQQLCPHFLTLSGAIKLADKITWSPFGVLSGPEVPFVVPHMLRDYPIKAVISQINVGSHTAYPIVYFSEVKPIKVEKPVCEWGNSIAVLVQKDGEFENLSSNSYHFLKEYADFDLAPWIKKEKVLWIEPGDEGLNLRSKSTGQCPYLNLSGRKDALLISRGNVWVGREKIIEGKIKTRKWVDPMSSEWKPWNKV
ncbi:MAG: hypothetical protein NW224_17525 [Leptolyngbyaceae cyanobacterium bins.302]|nr:hypothetical protein [Leptolyngbyaceae cyanobacterium bins.302]